MANVTVLSELDRYLSAFEKRWAEASYLSGIGKAKLELSDCRLALLPCRDRASVISRDSRMNEGPPTSASTTTKQANTSRKVKNPSGVGGKATGRTATEQLLARYALVIVFGVVFACFAITLPGLFLTVGNLKSMLSSQVVPLLLCVGVTMTLRLGDLDLSFAANANFCAMILAILTTRSHVSVVVALIVAAAVGSAVGLVNALFIVGFGLNGFIVTLGTMTVLTGVTAGLADNQVVTNIPTAVTNFATSQFFGLPLDVYYGWIVALAVWIVYDLTPFGRYLLFAGGNRDGARLIGIRVARIRVICYAVSGLIFGLAGITLLGSLGAADPSVANQYLLPPLAGAFIGLTTIQIGRFNIPGSILGLYLLLVISTGIQLAGAASWLGTVLDGAALVAAIGFARLIQGSGGANQVRNPGI